MKKFVFLLVIFCVFFAVPTKAQKDSILTQFELTIPANFNYDAEISKMMKLARQDNDPVYDYSSTLTSINFPKNEMLTPGVTYLVKILAIGFGNIEGQNCLNRLPKNIILPGLYGLLVTYKLNSDQIPKDRFIYSFDQGNNLGNNGNINIPCIYPNKKDKDYTFSVGTLPYYLRMYPCVLIFYEKKAT